MPVDTTLVPTASGGFLDLDNPKPYDVQVRDIAAHLAKLVRFVGAPGKHYSVAQHSVVVAHALAADPMAALYGLLHDAHEAYIGDQVAPVAAWQMRHFKVDGLTLLKDRLDQAVFGALGLDWPMPEPIAKAVTSADQAACATEWRDIMPCDCPHALQAKPFKKPIGQCWPWAKAEERFLETYTDLCIKAGVPPTGLWP